MIKTEVTIAGVTFKNPVMEGSGTFGSGMEYSEFVDLNRLGAVVTKELRMYPGPVTPPPEYARFTAECLMPSVFRIPASKCSVKGTFPSFQIMTRRS